jgi:hypothetical protein
MNGFAADPLGPALVRLVEGGRILGAGFLIGPDVVATCAHVVDGATPVADFPLLRSPDHAVEVLSQDDELDIAILRLTDPPTGALPVPARITGDVRDHRFRTFGFPRDLPDGIWVTGRLVGAQGAGRIQMAQDPDHWHIEPGFSGAPVWDEDLGGVVGMVVTFTARSKTTAHLVPINALGEAWTAPARNPYRGLKPYGEADADIFHGRDDVVAQLLTLLERQDIVAITGPSGSGKSSLLRAGLLPQLKLTGATITEQLPDDRVAELPDGTVLVLDQFEEEVDANPEAARQRLEELAGLVARRERQPGRPAPLRIVLTLRTRSLDELITDGTGNALNQAIWLLEPMRPEKLREAIGRPAGEVGVRAFEVGLLERIIGDTPHGHEALPLLSEVLKQLWDQPGTWLTHAAYEKLGGVSGALRKHADATLAALRPPESQRARTLLGQLTRPDGEGGFARRTADIGEFGPELQEIAHRLAAARLVVVNDQQVSLTHQALIDHWPQLRNWLVAVRDFLTWQANLRHSYDQWQAGTGTLLQGRALAIALGWSNSPQTQLPVEHRKFIELSQRRERRRRRTWQIVAAVLGVLILAVGILAGSATDQRHASNAVFLAQEANRATEGQPTTALQLALAAWREDPGSPEAYGALLQQRLYWRGVDRVFAPQMIGAGADTGIEVSADGRVIVIDTAQSDAVTVWTDLIGTAPTHRELRIGAENFPRLSPDGRLLAAYGKDGISLWDLASNSPPVPLGKGEFPYLAASFSANGRFLLGARASAVEVWDLSTAPPTRTGVLNLMVNNSARPSADGRQLLEDEINNADATSRVVARDLATGAEVRSFENSNLLGDGAAILTCSPGGFTVRDTTTDALLAGGADPLCLAPEDLSGQFAMIKNEAGNISGALHWPSGHRYAFASPDAALTRFDFVNSRIPALLLDPSGALKALSWSNGGLQLSTVDTTQSPSGEKVELLAQTPDKSRSLGKTANGDIALLGRDGETIGTLPLEYPGSSNAAFNRTGEHVAAVVGGSLRIFGSSDLSVEREIPLPPAADPLVYSFDSVLPDGGNGVIAVHDGKLTSWNPTTGEQLAAPLELSTPGDLDGRWVKAVRPRPGHPGEVVVQGREEISVWDLHARRMTRSLRADFSLSYSDFAIDPTGRYAARIDGDENEILMFDLDQGTPLPALPAQATSLDGIAGDYLFLQLGHEYGSRLVVWHWPTRKPVVDLQFNGTDPYRSRLVQDGRLFLDSTPGSQASVSLDAETLFRDLCRMSDRDFTQQEKDRLPGGVSTEPPCR